MKYNAFGRAAFSEFAKNPIRYIFFCLCPVALSEGANTLKKMFGFLALSDGAKKNKKFGPFARSERAKTLPGPYWRQERPCHR